MGNAIWNPTAYARRSRAYDGKSTAQVFTGTGLHADLDPSKFNVRESCDSPANPLSTPIIVAIDETGSMGYLATEIIKSGLGVIVSGIRDRKPVTDPHILLAAVGDATCDAAPIQTTQFEADARIVDQIEKFFIEGNGGGNGGESYPIVWWFAQNKTRCDAIHKRGRRGYLFTVGDEAPHPTLSRGALQRYLGASVESDVSVSDLLRSVQQYWNVFHLIVPTDSTRNQGAVEKWRALLGERAIVVSDHKMLAEVIVSVMQVNEGHDPVTVANSWQVGGNAVREALIGLTRPNGTLPPVEYV